MKLEITIEKRDDKYEVTSNGELTDDMSLVAIRALVEHTANAYRQVGAPEGYIVDRIARVMAAGIVDSSPKNGTITVINTGKIEEALG